MNNFITPLDFTGRAGNSLDAPDAFHHVFGGDATGKADLDATDKMNRALCERLIAKAETSDPIIHPFKEDGEDKRILLSALPTVTP